MCPKCRSLKLRIRQTVGMEWLKALLTRKRVYKCSECLHVFRATDRRKIARAEEADRVSLPVRSNRG